MTIEEMDRNIRAIFRWVPYARVPRDREGRVKVRATRIFDEDRIVPDYKRDAE